MKLRLFTGLALVLALGGCASYGYVDDGGGYYSGGPSSRTVYAPSYGGYGYGYGVYGYGSPYYSYRYTPGWSLGVGYGSPYGYYSRYPYYSGGGYYRPPYYNPRPPAHPPRPGGHDGRPDRPDRPPHHAGGKPHLDRAPWRDLDRVRDGNNGPRPQRQQAYPNRMRPDMVPRAEGETWQRPSSAQRPLSGPRPGYQDGEAGPRYRAPAGPRISSREPGDAGPRQAPPRMERRMEPRGGSRPSASSRGYTTGGQSETAATENP